MSDIAIPERRIFAHGYRQGDREGFVTSYSGFSAKSTPIFAAYSPRIHHWGEGTRDELLLWTIDAATGLCTLTQVKITDAVYEPMGTLEGYDSLAMRILTDLRIEIDGTKGTLGSLTFNVADLNDGGSTQRSLLLQQIPECVIACETRAYHKRDFGLVFSYRPERGDLMLGLRKLSPDDLKRVDEDDFETEESVVLYDEKEKYSLHEEDDDWNEKDDDWNEKVSISDEEEYAIV